MFKDHDVSTEKAYFIRDHEPKRAHYKETVHRDFHRRILIAFFMNFIYTHHEFLAIHHHTILCCLLQTSLFQTPYHYNFPNLISFVTFFSYAH